MNIAQNPYIIFMLFTSLSTGLISVTTVFLNYRNSKREKSGNVGTADAQTILANAQQNRTGALDLVKVYRDENDRLRSENDRLRKAFGESIDKDLEIHRLKVQVAELTEQLKGHTP